MTIVPNHPWKKGKKMDTFKRGINSKDILRFITIGNVDDGKSTLIGRLLLDSGNIMDDQKDSTQQAAKKRGLNEEALALYTDGLSEERNLGITIDVAYRYFSTPKRKFIVVDAPGHAEFTRNMVTGASIVNVAVLLIDVSKGITAQTKRHAYICSLLQVPHLMVCVNKMDLVNYSQHAFDITVTEFSNYAAKLNIPDIQFIPTSGWKGDNVIRQSENMPWYSGSTLMYFLENCMVANNYNHIDTRINIQSSMFLNMGGSVVAGYMGSLSGGIIRENDDITIHPSGLKSRINRIWGPSGLITEAFVPQPIIFTLIDDLKLSRGDVVSKSNNNPVSNKEIDAVICWMDNSPLNLKSTLILLTGGKEVEIEVKEILYRVNIETLEREGDINKLNINDIARVKITSVNNIVFDPYRKNRLTGSFILIDKSSTQTVAAGMIN